VDTSVKEVSGWQSALFARHRAFGFTALFGDQLRRIDGLLEWKFLVLLKSVYQLRSRGYRESRNVARPY
jgi:hypothetical protein